MRTSRCCCALAYYSTFHPHQGLGGAAPAEVYLDRPPAVKRAIPPSRKKTRESTREQPLSYEVVYLDAERGFPVLVPIKTAA